MKKLLPILIGLSLSGFSSLSQAENLMQVYQQARLSNPELRKSAADRDAAFEKINEARSPLLPQLGLGADYTYSNGYRDANGINSNATSASALNVENFKTDKPQPVNALLKEAEKRNLSLLQARLSQDLAREQIRQAQDGHLPTLDLTASTGISDTSYSGSKTRGAAGTQYDDSNMGQNKVGLSFSLPIYQGGMVNSQVKQAQYNFVGASEQLESAHRSVVQTVRSSFNNINASISSINAYKQAVVSAQSSLDAMEAGYSVGTRTIVDVLDATTTLYNAKQELANARYNYLINQLNIKSALGTLNEQDLLALNNALSKPVSTNPENVAPQTPEQNAIADGYAPDSPAPVVQQTSARTTTSNGHNPFRN